MKLALNMIVRNEAKNIAECVASVQSIVDEIVVLDTGSSDNTVDIARSLGAKVFHFEWCNDFAVARNEALSKVTAKWALVLDADERIAQKDREQILKIVDDERVDGYLMHARNYLKGAGFDKWHSTTGEYPDMEKGYAGYRDHFVLRLFRNCDFAKWDGRVHENLVCIEHDKRWFVKETDIVIHHFGKVLDEEQLNNKKKNYLFLTQKKAEERPGDAKSQYELGVQLHELGMWNECIGPFDRSYSLDKEYQDALYFIGNTFHKLGNLKKAEETLEKFLILDPEHCDALVTLACVKNEISDIDSAITLLDRAIKLNTDMFSAWFNKGVFLVQQERYEEAETVFEKVLELMPDYVPAMFGKWNVDIYLGNFKTAEASIKNWVTEHAELRDKVIGAAQKFMMAEKFEIIIHAIEPIVGLLDHAMSYSALGAAFLWANKIDSAEKNLEKALMLDKTLNTARINLAQIKQVYRKDKLAAVKFFEEALIYEPQNEFVQARIKDLKQS